MAKKLNLSLSTVSDWYNGVNYPRPDKLKLLSQALCVPTSYLTENRNNLNTEKYNNFPLGIPNEHIEYIDDYKDIFVRLENKSTEFFALKIKDESMLSKYQKGDIIIFQRVNNCSNGKCCAVMIENNNVLFRKIIKSEAGIILQPLNEKYDEPIFFSNKQIIEKNVKIIGIAKEIRRQVN